MVLLLVVGGVNASAKIETYDFVGWASGNRIVYERGNGTNWSNADVDDWNGISGVGVTNNGLGITTVGSNSGDNVYVSKTFYVGNESRVTYDVYWRFGTVTGRNDNWNYIDFGNFLRIGINSDYNVKIVTCETPNTWDWSKNGKVIETKSDLGYGEGGNAQGKGNFTRHIEVVFNIYTKTIESFRYAKPNENLGDNQVTFLNLDGSSINFNNTISTGFMRGGGGYDVDNYIQSITVTEEAAPATSITSSGKQYGNGYDYYYTYWNSLNYSGSSFDVSRFASRTDQGNQRGWWLGKNSSNDYGLQCVGEKYNPELIVTRLVSGDEITFDYSNNWGVLTLQGAAVQISSSTSGNIISVKYKITADGDIVVTGNNLTVLKKVEINRPAYGDFETVSNGDYSNTFRFIEAGKIVNENREITEMYGINVELGNSKNTNYTEVFECEDGEYAVKIYDENNYTWLWWPETTGHTHKIDFYEQGTFYKFEPTVSGVLTVEGVCINAEGGKGDRPLFLECYRKDDNDNWVWVQDDDSDWTGGDYKAYKTISGDERYKWSAPLKAGCVYYLYAEIYNTYCVKSFTYECKFKFEHRHVIVNDDLSVTNADKTDDYGKAREENGNIVYDGLNPKTDTTDATDIKYTIKPIGKINGEEINEDNINGVATVETDGSVSWNKDFRGAIVVTGDSHDGRAQYVITVPYKTNEWQFYFAAKGEGPQRYKEDLYENPAGGKYEWGLTWKIRSYTPGDKDRQLKYISNSVIASKISVNGDNARFISETAGLIIKTGKMDGHDATYGFGMCIGTPNIVTGDPDIDNSVAMDAYTLDDAYGRNSEDADGNPLGICDALTIKNGTTLTIPNLKKGQRVRMRWNRYSNRAYGERMIAYNLTDLNGVSMNEKVFFLGSGSYGNNKFGHQEFIVENDGNVSFELTGEGWSNIYNIAVGEVNEFLDTDMNMSVAAKDGTISVDKSLDVVDNGHADIFIYRRKAGKNKIEAPLSEDKMQQASLMPVYTIENRTGTLTEANCRIEGNTLIVEPGAHGRFTLIQNGYHYTGKDDKNDYTAVWKDETTGLSFMLDSLHAEVRVFEYDYNEKPYPYTWAMEHFTKDTGYNTLAEMNNDAKSFGGYWLPAEDGAYIFKNGYPENMIALKKKDGEKTANGLSRQTTIASWFFENDGQTVTKGTTFNVGENNDVAATLEFSGNVNNNFVAREGKEVSGHSYYTESKDNGNGPDGTFYRITPKYDGFITLGVVVSDLKNLCVVDESDNNKMIVDRLFPKKDYGCYTFEANKDHKYKVYANGSKLGFYGFSLVYGNEKEEFIPEFDGLGFIPEDYWDDSKENRNATLQPTHNGIILKDGKECQLIVPNVGVGQTVYLAVTDDTNESVKKKNIVMETVTEKVKETVDGKEVEKEVEKQVEKVVYNPVPKANENGKQYNVYVDTYEKGVGKDNNYDNGGYNPTNFSIYKIDGEGKDVELMLKDLTVHKVAVSVDKKDVSAAGYATEAREYPLDFTLAKLFLGEEQKAYKVIDVDKDGDMPNVTVSEVRYIPATTKDDVMNNPNVNNGVMITGDFLPERANRKPTTWPLFTTDIDRATSDMNGNLLVGVVAQSSIKNNFDDRTKGSNDEYYYNYMLAEKGYRVEYDSEEITDESIGKATSRVEGLGYYLALKIGTDMSAFGGGTYPGGKPKDNSAYLKIGAKSAKINEFAEKDKGNDDSNVQQTSMYVNSEGLFQVFFIDADSLATDIEDVPIDDELPTSDSAIKALHNGVFYTLQGVAVKNPTKGIYIFNGKKVYVK